MGKELKCPKCENGKRVKAKLITKKQRYLCKKCECHYTISQRGYPEHIKRKAIKLYLEGNGFRRIERILGIAKAAYIATVLLMKRIESNDGV